MDFEIYAPLMSILKLSIALAFFCFTGVLMDKALGFNLRGAIDALEQSAKDGNPLPMAIVLAAVVVTIGGILQRFL